jgi:hypothetical protein
MRNLVRLLLLLSLGAPSFAAGDDPVIYAGGTVSPPKAGATCSLDLSSGAALRFTSSDGTLEIPYSTIESFEHSNEVAVHLGVAPAIAVGMVAARKRNHFVRITFKDSNQVAQVAVFQVPKAMPIFLMPMLEAGAPQAQCRPYTDCTPRPPVARPQQQAAHSATSAAPAASK